MSFAQTVRAESSCLISWPQAAEYQAFSGNGFASLIDVLPDRFLYTALRADPLEVKKNPSRISRSVVPGATRNACCIQLRLMRVRLEDGGQRGLATFPFGGSIHLSGFHRVLDVGDRGEFDVEQIAPDPLHLADVDVLNDVAGLRVDRHRPSRARPAQPLHGRDQSLAALPVR